MDVRAGSLDGDWSGNRDDNYNGKVFFSVIAD